jgi:hypothetical protein
LGFSDPELWLVVVTASSVLLRVVREKIRADRDKALAEMALRDAKPSERQKIIDSLAKTKQFSPLPFVPRRSRPQVEPPPTDQEAA